MGREMLVGADRCLGDVVSEMLTTIEDSEDPHEEAHAHLVTLFPQFAHMFSEIKEVQNARTNSECCKDLCDRVVLCACFSVPQGS